MASQAGAQGTSRPQRRRRRLALLSLAAALTSALAVFAGAARAAVPEGFSYEEAYFLSADGTTLHADVLKPKDLRQGERTPVLMVITPYGAQAGCGGTFAPPTQVVSGPPCLTFGRYWTPLARRHRFSFVQVDLRGFGGSGGCWDAWGRGQQADVKGAVEWGASQPWSTGKVAVAGGSYEGWTGLTALATRPRGLVGVVALGGSYASVYEHVYMNRVPQWLLTLVTPAYGVWAANQPGSVLSTPQYQAQWLGRPRAGCVGAYDRDILNPDPDTPFWRERDLFELAATSTLPIWGAEGFLDYNVKPVTLTRLHARLKGARGLWLGQFIHDEVVDGETRIGREASGEVDRFLQRVLLGKRITVEEPAATVQEAPTLRWRAEAKWPPVDAERFSVAMRPGSYTDRSGNVAGDDVVAAGAPRIPASDGPAGVGTWTFTRPLPYTVHLAGFPRLRASADGPAQARLVALLYDVAPDGQALLITRGATVLGGGAPDIELYPQDWRLAPGHRLGLLISAADDSYWIPHAGTGAEVRVQAGQLSLPVLRCRRNRFLDGGRGQYWDQVKHPIQIAAGTIEQTTVAGQLPPAQETGGACAAIVQPSRRTCLARRSPIGPRNIGRIRLGYSRRRLLRLRVKPVRRTRRSFRYCVKRSRGRVRAVFSRRGRVALVATTARSHGNRGVRPGRRAQALRSAYPRRRALGRGLFRADRRSPRLVAVRKGRVRFVAVASRRLIRNPRVLRRYLRLAGL